MLRRASLIFLFYHRSWGGVRLRPCRLRVWRDEGLPEISYVDESEECDLTIQWVIEMVGLRTNVAYPQPPYATQYRPDHFEGSGRYCVGSFSL
ncbi:MULTISPECIES: hypothetical protein [Cutibacterium]|uniref:Uncharacterized protein n=1 Tax=Cutibacterium acnes TaxID=1747 RepID=A0A2B7II10_CUTAC|nr:hypothetical protein [Cutibacterium acnes]EFS38205.1 hypothetical protein HMPREF9574_01537 [Cutibacterium acnes HL074PA1]EFS53630.1 hypothetical protein HMPREF9589_01065 [Cutibacterium acnes HL059PA1]EFS71517.1 hypothetical protein HMPREF9617_01353 [Cutibacterium acnes HL056PA1]EFS79200.1 hypothetical protein HMPREF9597_01349 [Cutibacterium acnes HL005PA4]EFS95511.1 hypothetical protein HMPREF9608_00852 [Cutibacterium acnes HL067PA1]EFT12011.1 hypothetical protein HMPREF9620_02248 [Cutibac